MPESIIGDDVWVQMTEIERIEVVRSGRATLRQLSKGLLDGPKDLRAACREFLTHTGDGLEELSVSFERNAGQAYRETASSHSSTLETPPPIEHPKSRSGLPQDYGPRRNRYGRTRLLEQNIYRLPDGQEFVPCGPSGTLGSIGHRYALLTICQHDHQQRGSVYIRNDGRIFDYSKLALDSRTDLFDTGYTINDLERTGRYANKVQKRSTPGKRKAQSTKSRASHG
jgi:hypothetical protein